MLACITLLAQGCAVFHPTPPPAEPAVAHKPSENAKREPGFKTLEPGSILEQVRALSAAPSGRGRLRISPAEAGYYMDVQEARLRQALPPHTAFLIRDPDAITIRMSGAFMFGGDSHLNPAAQNTLDSIAEILAEFPKTFVVVAERPVPVDDSGHDPALSASRVLAVARYFAGHGVERRRIAMVGRGKLEAADDSASGAGPRPDQTVDITLISIPGGA